MQKYEPSVPFWSNGGKTITSHAGGLTAEQVEFLQNLQVGERLVIFHNGEELENNRPNYTLKRSKPMKGE